MTRKSDYFHHHTNLPVGHYQLDANKNRMRYQHSSIEFTPQVGVGLALRSTNITAQAQTLSINVDSIDINNTSGTTTISCDGDIHIACEQLKLTVGNNHITLDDDAITCHSAQLELSTPSIIEPTAIACKGDQHYCPQSNGPGNPHIGGTIIEGSPNVTINDKPIARHHDSALCQTQPNSIISQLTSISVNGRAIAHRQAFMQHGGYIGGGNEQTLLSSSIFDELNNSSQTTTLKNIIEINCDHSSMKQLTINFADNQQTTQLQPSTTTLTNLSDNDLTDIFQLNITHANK